MISQFYLLRLHSDINDMFYLFIHPMLFSMLSLFNFVLLLLITTYIDICSTKKKYTCVINDVWVCRIIFYSTFLYLSISIRTPRRVGYKQSLITSFSHSSHIGMSFVGSVKVQPRQSNGTSSMLEKWLVPLYLESYKNDDCQPCGCSRNLRVACCTLGIGWPCFVSLKKHL